MVWKKITHFFYPFCGFIILYLVSPWSRCGQTPCCLTNKLFWTCAENNTTKRFTSHIFQFIELGQPLRSLRLTPTIGQSVVFMQSIGAISRRYIDTAGISYSWALQIYVLWCKILCSPANPGRLFSPVHIYCTGTFFLLATLRDSSYIT